ncbi:MAG: pentapeptide repeat-containing protein [Bacteroidales bacterium]|nr:pentapeptide repeat-containing protein [Bacteroidales bacterium]
MKFYTAYLLLLIFSFTACSQPKEQEIVNVSTIAKQIKKGENVLLVNKRISGDLLFYLYSEPNDVSLAEFKSFIESSISFQNCIFEGKVIAYEKRDNATFSSCFLKNLTFINCKFTNEVNLRDCEVDGSINFTDSEFSEQAIFEGLIVKGRTCSFNNCIFNEIAKFQRTEYYQAASFFKVQFLNEVNFQASYFYKDAVFRSAQFKKKAVFSSLSVLTGLYFNYAIFEDQILFQNVQCFDKAVFSNAVFMKDVNFKRCNFYESVSFNTAKFDSTLVLKDCNFMRGKPDFENSIIIDTLKPIFENCNYTETKALKFE